MWRTAAEKQTGPLFSSSPPFLPPLMRKSLQVVSVKAGEGGGRREQTENHAGSHLMYIPCEDIVFSFIFRQHSQNNLLFTKTFQHSQAFSPNFFSRCTNNTLMFSIKHNGNQEICCTDKTICFQSSCVFHNKCLETVQAAERKLRQITLSSSADGF